MAMSVLLLLRLSVQTAHRNHLGLSANVTGKQAQNAQYAGKHLHPVTVVCISAFSLGVSICISPLSFVDMHIQMRT